MNKILLTIIALTITLGGFTLGRSVGENAAGLKFERINLHLSKLNAVGAYSTYAGISSSISEGDPDYAKCIADSYASVHFKNIRTCLTQTECRNIIFEDVKKSNPELLDENKSFTNYENLPGCKRAMANK